MNTVILTGRVGQEPKVFTFDNGNKKTSFSLAVTEYYKDKTTETWKDTTDWFNIALFRETKIRKGDFIELSGKLKTRTYEKDGEKKYLTEVVAHTVKLLSRPKGQPDTTYTEPAQYNKTNNDKATGEGEDLPF